jgi:hypothetical protein
MKLIVVPLLLMLTVQGLDQAEKTPYTEYYFDQELDHFNFGFYGNQTYKQRYLVQDDFWDVESKGPIFFYTGNEGSIDGFYKNSGFIPEIAPAFKGEFFPPLFCHCALWVQG